MCSSIFCVSPCAAGELTAFTKTGYYTLTEKEAGRTWVAEEGVMSRSGLRYDLPVTRHASLGLSGSLDAGYMTYQGQNMTDQSPLHSTTYYLGTTEEVNCALHFQVGGRVKVSPTAAAGHRWYVRHTSDELWNIFYGKAGVDVEGQGGGYRWKVSGGGYQPFATVNRIDWSRSGYGPAFAVRPVGALTPYGEISVGKASSRLRFSVFFEQNRWKKSPRRQVQRTVGSASGAIAVGAEAWQPDTRATTAGLLLQYTL